MEGSGTCELVEARQYTHLKTLDTTFYEGYTVLREAAGEDLRATNLLTSSYGPYLAFRRELLKRRLLDSHAVHETSGSYTPHDRFGLDTCGDINAPVETSFPTASLPSAPATSYAAWRRAFLSRRLVARHAALQDDIDKKLAADAMQRALAAQAAEIGEVDDALISHAPSPGKEPEPLVWRIKGHLELFEVESAGSFETISFDRRPNLRVESSRPLSNKSISSASKSKVICCMSFSPTEPDFVAIGTEGGDIAICNTTTSSKWLSLSGHTAPITGLSWMISTSENVLVSVSLDKSIRVWQVSFPRKVAPPPLPTTPHSALGRGGRRKSVPGSPSNASNTYANRSGEHPTTPRKQPDRATELEKAKKELEAEAERARIEAERVRGVRLEGGSAYCIKVIQTDFMLSHISCWPKACSLIVVAAVEDADLDVEDAVEAAEARMPSSSTSDVSHQDSGFGVDRDGKHGGLSSTFSPVSKMGGMMVKGIRGGIKGSVAAARKVGDVTMGAIEAVPVVGGAVGGAVNKTVSIMKAGMGAAIQGVTGRKERRGYVLVLDIVTGRIVQSKRIAGTRSAATLTKVNSYVTGLAFAMNASALFIADARGLIHVFPTETDPEKAAAKPFKDSYVGFGEGSNRMSNFGGQKVATPVDGSPDDAVDSMQVHLTSLEYKPMDPTYRSPLLIGLDSTSHVRALKISVAEQRTTIASAAAAGAKVAAGAVAAVATGNFSSTASTGPVYVMQEVALVHYTNGMPSLPADADNSSTYGSSSFSKKTAGRASSPLVSPNVEGIHSSCASSALSDAVFCGTKAGEIFVLNPHADGATQKYFGLLPGGTAASAGSGIAPQQVAAKLVGHVNAIKHIALNEFESAMISSDSQGNVLTWEKLPLSAAEKAGGATGYVSEMAASALSVGMTLGSKVQTKLFEQINQSSVGRAALLAARGAGEQASIGRPPLPSPSPLRNMAGNLGQTNVQAPGARQLPAAWRNK